MRRDTKLYTISWAVMLVLFNIIAFVVPQEGKYEAAPFWLGYISVTLAFVGQLVCTLWGLRDEDRKRTFYNISLVTTSFTGLVVTGITGCICIAFATKFTGWFSAVICSIVLAINIVAVLKAQAAIGVIARVDAEVKAETAYIRLLITDADLLVGKAVSEEARAACKRVADAVRYSDPVSSPALAGIEGEMATKFTTLSTAVEADDVALVKSEAEAFLLLLKNRNDRCKILK